MTATAHDLAARMDDLIERHENIREEFETFRDDLLDLRPNEPRKTLRSRIAAFFHLFYRRRPMDLAQISTVIDTASARISQAIAELQVATQTAAELDKTKADLAASQAEIAAAESTIGDLTTKLSMTSDALASVLPAPAATGASSAA